MIRDLWVVLSVATEWGVEPEGMEQNVACKKTKRRSLTGSSTRRQDWIEQDNGDDAGKVRRDKQSQVSSRRPGRRRRVVGPLKGWNREVRNWVNFELVS